jgi:hypothetical protein
MNGYTAKPHIIADPRDRRRVPAHPRDQFARKGHLAKVNLNDPGEWAVLSHNTGKQSGMTEPKTTVTQENTATQDRTKPGRLKPGRPRHGRRIM